MNEEIFGILNDADDVMESVGCDPLGMNVVEEGMENVNLNSLTAKDLQNPEKLNMVKAKIASMDSTDGLMNAYSKVNKLMSLGGAALTAVNHSGGNEEMRNIAGVLTLGNVVLGAINKKIKKSVTMKEYNELKKIDGLLTKAIADMKNNQTKASKDERDKIQDAIDKAEQMKAYIASKQDKQMSRHA